MKYKALDIGRHNAIDKVVGMATMAGDDLSKMFLLSSGRQPAGMVMKAVRAKIPADRVQGGAHQQRHRKRAPGEPDAVLFHG